MSSNQDTRAQIQARQDAANAAAAAANAKILAQAEQSRLNQYYVTNPNNLPIPQGTNIDMSSPAGRALYEAYKDSGVVFDSKNNVIYNPADLGAYQAEQARSAQGFAPSFKQSGAPSPQYQNSLVAAGVSSLQLQDIMKERSNLVSITNTNRAELNKIAQEKKAVQEQLDRVNAELAPLQSRINAINTDTTAKITGFSGQSYKKTWRQQRSIGAEGAARVWEIEQRAAPLRQQAAELSSKISGYSSRQEVLGVNLSNIEKAQVKLKDAETKANYERSFTPKAGATAGVKSVVEPIKYTKLTGSTITARQLKTMKDMPATPENLNPSRVIAGGFNYAGKSTIGSGKAPSRGRGYEGLKMNPQGQASGAIQRQLDYQKSITKNMTPKVAPSSAAIVGAAAAPQLKGNLVSPINSAIQAGAKEVTITTPSGKKQTMSIDNAIKYSQTANEPGQYSFSWLGASKPDKTQARQANQDYNKSVQGIISDARAKGATEIIVTDESGKRQTFQLNRAFYDIKKLGNQNLSFSYSKLPEIPEGYTLAGSIANQVLIPERNNLVGPAVPPTLAAQKKAEKITGINLSVIQPVSSAVDAAFELSTPLEQRTKTNQILAGVAAPFVATGATIYDTSRAVAREIKRPGAGFEFRGTDIEKGGNPLNFPYPKIESDVRGTAFSNALSGKPVNLSDPFTQGTIIGDVSAVALGVVGIKGTTRTSQKIKTQIESQQGKSQMIKELEKIETPKVIIEKTVPGIESSVGKTGRLDISKSKLINPNKKPELESAKIRVSQVEGRSDLFSIESTNPAADKFIFGQKTGKKFNIISVEKAGQISKPNQVGIRGIIGTEEQRKFNLKPTGKQRFVSSGSPTPSLDSALGTTSLQPVARVKTFSLSELIKNPKESGRYLFGETTPLGDSPVLASQDILIADTRAFNTVGSKVLGQAPNDVSRIPQKNTRLERRIEALLSKKPDTFQAYSTKKIRLSFEKPKNFRQGLDSITGKKLSSTRIDDTYASDLLRVTSENPFMDLTKYQKKSNFFTRGLGLGKKSGGSSTFSSLGKGYAGGTGKAKAIQITKEKAEELVKTEIPKKQESGFSSASGSALGVNIQTDEPMRYPPGTKLNRPSFTSRIKTNESVFEQLVGSQVTNKMPSVDPFGLITKSPQGEQERNDSGLDAIINPKRRSDFPRTTNLITGQNVSNLFKVKSTSTRTKSQERTINSTIEAIIPRLDTGQGQKQKEKTQQQEKTIYEEIYNPPQEPQKDFFETGRGRGFVPPYYGGSGGSGGRGSKKFAKRKFVVSDVSRVIPRGVYYGRQYVSSSPSIFKKFDKLEQSYLKKLGYYGGKRKRLPRGFDFF